MVCGWCGVVIILSAKSIRLSLDNSEILEMHVQGTEVEHEQGSCHDGENSLHIQCPEGRCTQILILSSDWLIHSHTVFSLVRYPDIQRQVDMSLQWSGI